MGIEDQDDLLKEALASYAGREPRAGIEARVLRRVRAPGLARRSGWALVLLAAACVIVTMMIPREETMDIAVPALVAPTPVVVKAEGPRAIERPDRFPSPAPLTREERMLLVLADSDLAKSAFADLGDAGITPIQIDAISILPIGD
jgi:hypothetical protein